ncbi:hypothetical protein ACG9ZL_16475 [Acinetobacter sp. ULE_I057]|uniref:hypothetical protein n=1 Tax=Acinetobacter sp. ULE_I057 TaxID=3373070 RepID=UPI003AF4432C
MSEKTKFSTREWILSIIILLIMEAFIFWVAFQFAGNSSALGYVSFAGTLISIILAVLAIGYTYGESQQQKNSSETLSTQISSLVKIKDKLKIQAEALEDIKIVKKNMINISDQIDDHFNRNNSRIEVLNENFSQLAKQTSLQSSIDINSRDFFDNVKNFNNAHNYLDFVFAALFFEKEFENADHLTFDELVRVLDESELDLALLGITKEYAHGRCISILNCIFFMNLVHYESNYINYQLIDLFKFCAEKITQFQVDSYNFTKLTSMKNKVINSELFNKVNKVL